MTAPVTSSSSPTSSARRVHPFPPRRQDKTISNARNPSNPTNTIGQGSQLPFLPPPLREKFYLKKKCVSIINEKVFATKKELKICTQSLHTALRKGWKEGISTPRLLEIYCFDSLSLGSHRRPEGRACGRNAEICLRLSSGDVGAAKATAIGASRLRPSPAQALGSALGPRGPGAPGGVRGGWWEAGRRAGGRRGG